MDLDLIELSKTEPKRFNVKLKGIYRLLTKTESNLNDLIKLFEVSEIDLIKLNQDLNTLKDMYLNSDYLELDKNELQNTGLILINDLFLKNILLKQIKLIELIKKNCLICT